MALFAILYFECSYLCTFLICCLDCVSGGNITRRWLPSFQKLWKRHHSLPSPCLLVGRPVEQSPAWARASLFLTASSGESNTFLLFCFSLFKPHPYTQSTCDHNEPWLLTGKMGWQVAVVSVGDILQTRIRLAPHQSFSKSTFPLSLLWSVFCDWWGGQGHRHLLSELT